MKKTITFIASLYSFAGMATPPPITAQNGNSGALGLYGNAFFAATTFNTGGFATVGTGGNWVLGGNIISAGKSAITNSTNSNGISATVQAEAVIFSGNGTYQIGTGGASGTPAAVGTAGTVIEGYAGVSDAKTGSFILPLGNETASYPLTVPAATATTAAYYDGGAIGLKTVSGTSGNNQTTVFAQYYDLPGKTAAGTYTLSYPAGLTSGNNSILYSTDNGSTFLFGANITAISSAAGTTASTALPDPPRFYMATSVDVLPVTLTSFTGTPAQCSASLFWATTMEANFSGFGVQYAADGVNFATVGTVANKGNSLGSAYSYSYNQPAGEGWYRLKMNDWDGSATYSQIVTVSTNCNASVVLSVYPNPTSSMVTVTGIVGKAQIRVVNSLGQVLQTVETSQVSQTINISHLPN
jgi:hypothetical protein